MTATDPRTVRDAERTAPAGQMIAAQGDLLRTDNQRHGGAPIMPTTRVPDQPRELRTNRRPRARGALIGAVALAALGASSATVAASDPVGRELGSVRAATAQFQRVAAADAAGYQLGWKDPDIPIDGCIAHPTEGAMGYHWFDHDAIEDIALDPLRPEGLVYERLPNGKLHLVAVEWIVPSEAWHAEHDDPPTVLGQEMGVLNPRLGWYILHAWVWKPNPAGMFENWNPAASCP